MATSDTALEGAPPQLNWRQRVAEARLPWLPIAILLALLRCAAFASWVAPHDPDGLTSSTAIWRPSRIWITRWGPTYLVGIC